jgi:hypothetical protein
MNMSCIDNMSTVNFSIYFLSLVPFITIVSIILSSLVVVNVKSNTISKKDDELEEEKIYTELYTLDGSFDEYKNNYKNICIIENTPNGLVLLKYNDEDEIWEYWTNNKNNVKFDELDTVARKFCKIYKCNNLYINRKNKKEEDDNKEDNNKEDDNKEDDNKEDDDDSDLFIKSKKLYKNDKALIYNSNSYRYKGKIKNIDLFNKKKEKKEELNESVSWYSWNKKN